jgi:hypothetical protein
MNEVDVQWTVSAVCLPVQSIFHLHICLTVLRYISSLHKKLYSAFDFDLYCSDTDLTKLKLKFLFFNIAHFAHVRVHARIHISYHFHRAFDSSSSSSSPFSSLPSVVEKKN